LAEFVSDSGGVYVTSDTTYLKTLTINGEWGMLLLDDDAMHAASSIHHGLNEYPLTTGV
jgi:hypothetical protein